MLLTEMKQDLSIVAIVIEVNFAVIIFVMGFVDMNYLLFIF